jgi:hypothetical protein
LKHHASPEFWNCYRKLPLRIRKLADKNFELLKTDPMHPSLHLKRVDKFCSVRVGLSYRSLGIAISDGILWFWIGSHSEYDKIIP